VYGPGAGASRDGTRGRGLVGAHRERGPGPTEWSGEGERELLEEEASHDRLGPDELDTAGRAPIAGQVRGLRAMGVDAWAWLPTTKAASDLADYAKRQGADVVLVPPDLERPTVVARVLGREGTAAAERETAIPFRVVGDPDDGGASLSARAPATARHPARHRARHLARHRAPPRPPPRAPPRPPPWVAHRSLARRCVRRMRRIARHRAVRARARHRSAPDRVGGSGVRMGVARQGRAEAELRRAEAEHLARHPGWHTGASRALVLDPCAGSRDPGPFGRGPATVVRRIAPDAPVCAP
jgi:hypothetical protein